MFYYTYVLQSKKNKSLYIGYTADLRKRLKDHNAGINKSTKPFIPYKLIFYESFIDKQDAKNREIYLKGGYGRKTLNSMVEKYFLRNL